MSDKFSKEDVDRFLEEMLECARQDIIPKMRASLFCLLVFVPSAMEDPYCALQLGAAILLDKPLVIFAMNGVYVPERLRRLAEAVIVAESPQDPAAKEALMEALRKMVPNRGMTQ